TNCSYRNSAAFPYSPRLLLPLSLHPTTRPPPTSTLFPYTTLFRSRVGDIGRELDGSLPPERARRHRICRSIEDGGRRHPRTMREDRKSTRRTPVTSGSRMPSSA